MASKLRVDSILPVDGAPTNGGGGIIQVVQAVTGDAQSIGTQTYTTLNNLSLAITPKFNTSKILINVSLMIGINVSTNTVVSGRIFRGSTDLSINSSSDNHGMFVRYIGNNTETMEMMNYMHLDSPATTSATTYSIKLRGDNDSAFYVNRYANTSGYKYQSSITLMEVSA